MKIIAGDVGGTKTLLQLREFSGASWQTRLERRYESGMYPAFDALLREFFALINGPVSTACFAVAGPVVGRRASITNLPWVIDADEISRTFSIPRVVLVNDFYAVAAGVPLLSDQDRVSVHAGVRDLSFPVALVGAGTGLGEAVLVPTLSGWQVVSSEGGHCDFAPLDDEQGRLLSALRRRYGHVSYERILSGQGLVNIFSFLRDESPEQEEPLGADEDAAVQIAKMAAAGDALAARTFEIFIDVYGAEAGNLALKVLARGGVYIAGGIAAKNLPRFTDGRFVRSFLAKGRMTELMKRIPVDVIINQNVGLIGAADLAAREAATL
jgi:glucokinase